MWQDLNITPFPNNNSLTCSWLCCLLIPLLDPLLHSFGHQERYTCPSLALHPLEESFVAQTNGDYMAVFSSQQPYRMNKRRRYEGHKVSNECGLGGVGGGLVGVNEGLIDAGCTNNLCYNPRVHNTVETQTQPTRHIADVAPQIHRRFPRQQASSPQSKRNKYKTIFPPSKANRADYCWQIQVKAWWADTVVCWFKTNPEGHEKKWCLTFDFPFLSLLTDYMCMTKPFMSL